MTTAAAVPSKPRLAVLTGAGISAPSGLPVYRGGDGLWDRDPDAAKFSTASRWHGRAQEAWDHWNELRRASYVAQPNAAHHALVAAEDHFEVRVATQNIDGLHTRAGSADVVELHGNVFHTRCSRKACHSMHGAWFDDELHDPPPTCPHCGRLARLDVVLFEEQLPSAKIRAAIDASRHADIWIAVGTSGTVFPAAGLIDYCLPGTTRVLVNAQPWEDPDATFDREVIGDAAETLAATLTDLAAGLSQRR